MITVLCLMAVFFVPPLVFTTICIKDPTFATKEVAGLYVRDWIILALFMAPLIAYIIYAGVS